MDWRHYDPVLGRFNAIDALAVAYKNQTPYHYSMNNPVALKDNSGLHTIINNQGIVTEHVDNDDSNIYLGSLDGAIVGTEELGKEYKKGDIIFEVDNNIDTVFELLIETIETVKNMENYADIIDKFTLRLKEISDKLEKNIPLSESDRQFLLNAKDLRETFDNIKEFYYLKMSEIIDIIEETESNSLWKDSSNLTLRMVINELTGKLPLVGSLEDARNGETISDKLKDKYTEKPNISSEGHTTIKLSRPLSGAFTEKKRHLFIYN